MGQSAGFGSQLRRSFAVRPWVSYRRSLPQSLHLCYGAARVALAGPSSVPRTLLGPKNRRSIHTTIQYVYCSHSSAEKTGAQRRLHLPQVTRLGRGTARTRSRTPWPRSPGWVGRDRRAPHWPFPLPQCLRDRGHLHGLSRWRDGARLKAQVREE